MVRRTERVRNIRAHYHEIPEEYVEKEVLNSSLIQKICDYLENPTKSGIWYLKADYTKKEGISKDIAKEFENAVKDKDKIEIQSGRRKIIVRLPQEEKENIIRNTWRMTLIFTFFSYMLHSEKKSEESLPHYLETQRPEDKLIFDIIDIEKIKKKYKGAYDYFKKYIYFKEYNPLITTNEVLFIKNGFIILMRHLLRSDNLIVVSIDQSSLKKFETFLKKTGKITNSSILPVFSPEEEVFEPYFYLLNETYFHFIKNENTKRLFKKAIDEYSDGNHPYCISTIGLIAEDHLTQIYETFFRDTCPKALSLGQIYDQINSQIRRKFQKETESLPDINQIFKKINELIKNNKSKNKNIDSEILKIVRETLNFIKEDKKHVLNIIESIEKKKETISVFPKNIRENIIELIKYRNATSHKLRIPVGSYEALRTVYCCVTLIMWWINEKGEVNWKNYPDDIIKNSIKRNTGIILK